MLCHSVFRGVFFFFLLGVAYNETPVHAEIGKGGQGMTVTADKDVSIEYTLKLKDQEVLDTNVGADPLTYTHGHKQLVPGLEKELEGMSVGEKKQVTVSPEEGYGEVNPKAFLEIEKEKMPFEPDALSRRRL